MPGIGKGDENFFAGKEMDDMLVCTLAFDAKIIITAISTIEQSGNNNYKKEEIWEKC
jgi:hypothetical protein